MIPTSSKVPMRALGGARVELMSLRRRRPFSWLNLRHARSVRARYNATMPGNHATTISIYARTHLNTSVRTAGRSPAKSTWREEHLPRSSITGMATLGNLLTSTCSSNSLETA